MKLASITLPFLNARCAGLYEEKYDKLLMGHARIHKTLIDWCRGYTKVTAVGTWVFNCGTPCHEDVYRYEFTSPDTKTARAELRALAYSIMTLTDEEAIFIIHANGNTEIIE